MRSKTMTTVALAACLVLLSACGTTLPTAGDIGAGISKPFRWLGSPLPTPGEARFVKCDDCNEGVGELVCLMVRRGSSCLAYAFELVVPVDGTQRSQRQTSRLMGTTIGDTVRLVLDPIDPQALVEEATTRGLANGAGVTPPRIRRTASSVRN